MLLLQVEMGRPIFLYDFRWDCRRRWVLPCWSVQLCTTKILCTMKIIKKSSLMNQSVLEIMHQTIWWPKRSDTLKLWLSISSYTSCKIQNMYLHKLSTLWVHQACSCIHARIMFKCRYGIGNLAGTQLLAAPACWYACMVVLFFFSDILWEQQSS